jgi:probable F420-dependent oxidoreductase
MNVGVQIPATAETGNMVDLGRLAEEFGFESYFIGEHVTLPSGFRSVAPGSHRGVLPEHYGRWMDPFVILAAVAGATSRIKLGTGVCLPVQRNVLVLAKEIATLDVVSSGRLIVGVGTGWIREECEAVGIPFAQRWKRLRESVEAMRVLWREAEPFYEGELIHFPPLRCEPKPVQAGGPPILLGAGGAALGGNPRVLERVARTYDGWFPVAGDPAIMAAEIATIRRLAVEYGRAPAAVTVTAMFAEPAERATVDRLRRLWDAGVERIVLHERSDVIAMAAGRGHAAEILKRLSAVADRAANVS